MLAHHLAIYASSTPTCNNITWVQQTNCYNGNFRTYENHTHHEKRQLQVREKASGGPLPRLSLSPHGDTHAPAKDTDEPEEPHWAWQKYPETKRAQVRAGGYTGTQLIEIRGEDKLKTCYLPLSDPVANLRPQSWQLASPMWRPWYQIAVNPKYRARVPWWARPTENLQPSAAREMQMAESQKWQLLLERTRQGRVMNRRR